MPCCVVTDDFDHDVGLAEGGAVALRFSVLSDGATACGRSKRERVTTEQVEQPSAFASTTRGRCLQVEARLERAALPARHRHGHEQHWQSESEKHKSQTVGARVAVEDVDHQAAPTTPKKTNRAARSAGRCEPGWD